ncbi:MAG: UbiA family prenyltransferase [Anaerolineales bacterium]
MNTNKVRALLRLFRFELPFAAGICVLLGELLALGTWPTAREAVLGFSSVFLLSAAALILNDYFDVAADRVNAPDRPLPSGQVTEREVLLLFAAVTILGLGLSYLIGLQALGFAALVWAVGVLYNWRLKRTGLLGNLMVSLSVGLTFVFGALTVGRPLEELVWFFTLTAMLIDLGEEIGVDALDAEGDREIGSQSLALKLGRESALRISSALFLTVVLWSGVPFLLGWLSWPYLLPLGLMDGVILYSLAQVIVFESASPRKYLRWIYLSGLAAMLIFLVMRLLD